MVCVWYIELLFLYKIKQLKIFKAIKQTELISKKKSAIIKFYLEQGKKGYKSPSVAAVVGEKADLGTKRCLFIKKIRSVALAILELCLSKGISK